MSMDAQDAKNLRPHTQAQRQAASAVTSAGKESPSLPGSRGGGQHPAVAGLANGSHQSAHKEDGSRAFKSGAEESKTSELEEMLKRHEAGQEEVRAMRRRKSQTRSRLPASDAMAQGTDVCARGRVLPSARSAREEGRRREHGQGLERGGSRVVGRLRSATARASQVGLAKGKGERADGDSRSFVINPHCLPARARERGAGKQGGMHSGGRAGGVLDSLDLAGTWETDFDKAAERRRATRGAADDLLALLGRNDDTPLQQHGRRKDGRTGAAITHKLWGHGGGLPGPCGQGPRREGGIAHAWGAPDYSSEARLVLATGGHNARELRKIAPNVSCVGVTATHAAGGARAGQRRPNGIKAGGLRVMTDFDDHGDLGAGGRAIGVPAVGDAKESLDLFLQAESLSRYLAAL